ncbi:glycosyltransferase [Fusobacterium sp. SYSU M8D902]|uniref:glycosyltransferase n=1 Tax=Fusobacterium sp. SYSU M8D902 TaxID=3159562 RepID=UPI0032E4F701
MNNIKVSIIIPVYNTSKFLTKCLDSVLNQSLKEVEIILLNDGSMDKSDEICLEYSKKYKNIKYINKKNTGCSDTRNLGIKMAKGEYIAFLDSDDYVEKSMYEVLYNQAYLEKLDIMMCGILYHNLIEKNQYSVSPKRIKKFSDFFLYDILIASPCNKIFKKELILKNNIYFPVNTHQGEDLVFCFKSLSFTTEVKYINKDYYHYQIHGNNSIFDLEKKSGLIISFNEMFRFLNSFSQKYPNKKVLLEIFYKLLTIHVMRGLFVRMVNNKVISDNNYKKYSNIYLNEIKKMEYLRFKEWIIALYYKNLIYLIRRLNLFFIIKKIRGGIKNKK